MKDYYTEEERKEREDKERKEKAKKKTTVVESECAYPECPTGQLFDSLNNRIDDLVGTQTRLDIKMDNMTTILMDIKTTTVEIAQIKMRQKDTEDDVDGLAAQIRSLDANTIKKSDFDFSKVITTDDVALTEIVTKRDFKTLFAALSVGVSIFSALTALIIHREKIGAWLSSLSK